MMDAQTIVTIVGVSIAGIIGFAGGLSWIGRKIADVAGKLATLTALVTQALEQSEVNRKAIEAVSLRVDSHLDRVGGDD